MYIPLLIACMTCLCFYWCTCEPYTIKTDITDKLLEMAFVAPVVKHNYDLYTKECQDRITRKKGQAELIKERKQNPSSEARDDQIERRRRMEILRERRQRRYPKRQTKVVLRKISEINEEAEDELYFDEMMKGFTKLRAVQERDEESSDSSREEDLPVRSRVIDEQSPKKNKKKRPIFGLLLWTPFPFRNKTKSSSQKVRT